MTSPHLAFAAALALALPVAAGAQDHGNHGRNTGGAAAQANGNPAERGPDPIVAVRDTDVVMNAAIAEAQATLPHWIETWEKRPRGYSNFAFKFPLEGYEHIWVAIDRREGEVLIGTLANAPHAAGWSLGDEVRVPVQDVSDWAYFDNAGKAHGYRTVRVLFDQMDPREVNAIKRRFGWE